MCSNKSTQGAERGQNQIKHDSSNVVRKNNTKAKNKKVFAKAFLTSIYFTLWHSKQVWHKKMSSSGKEVSCYSITQFFFYAYHIDSFSPENSLFLSPETAAMQAAEQKKKDACVLQQRGAYQSVAAVVGL